MPTASRRPNWLGARSGDREAEQDHEQEQGEHGDGADEAQLLGQHGEGEVGVLLGQEAELGLAALQVAAAPRSRPSPARSWTG